MDKKIKALNETLNSMYETNEALVKKLNAFKKKLDDKDAQINKLKDRVEALETSKKLRERTNTHPQTCDSYNIKPTDFIKDVKFFNNKTTVVYWRDNAKTVVVTQDGDTFNKELGLAMAISKKAFGNTGAFNDVFKKYCYVEDSTK